MKAALDIIDGYVRARSRKGDLDPLPIMGSDPVARSISRHLPLAAGDDAVQVRVDLSQAALQPQVVVLQDVAVAG